MNRLTAQVVVTITLLTMLQPCHSAKNETNRYAQMMTDIIDLAPGNPLTSSEKRTFTAKAPQGTGKRTLLFLEIRMDCPSYGGCNYGMSLSVNGRDLGTAKDWMNSRLIGKSLMAYVKNYPGAEGPWVRAGWWLLMYAPDFADKQIEEGDDCVFLWDVSDLLKPDGTIEITLESQTKRLEDQIKKPVNLKIGRFQLGVVDEKTLERELDKPLPIPPVAKGAILKSKEFSCWLAPGGGMVVSLGKEKFFLRSQLTYPGKPKGGWNTLEPSTTQKGEPLWKPVIQKQGNTLGVDATSPTYAFSRRLHIEGHRIVLRDTFKNLTDQIIGLRFRNDLDCTGKAIRDVAVSGDQNPDAAVSGGPGDNPTLFVKMGQVGLGMLIEDDVFRVQSKISFSYPLGSIGSDNFGLAPKATYTTEWTLYPTPTGDAWDFINQVRRDWDVNFTIPCLCLWTDCSVISRMSDADLKKYLELSGAKWFMATPWLDTYPLPTRPTREQTAEAYRPAAEKLRRICPDARLVPGTHPTMNFAIPGKGYDGDAYRDSFIIDDKGKHFWSPPYTSYFVVGIGKEQGYLNFCNYMVPGNSYFKKMIDEADFALDQGKAGGIYCDEFNHYNCVSPTTYGQWDQHYVELDENTYEPKTTNPCAQLSLVTDEAQQLYAEHIMKKGGVFYANAQPVTRRMQKLHFTRFVETYMVDRAFHSALFSPLCYGNPPLPTDEAALFQYLRVRLECGVLTHPGGMPNLTRPCLTAKMFPFTPVDVRPGVLTGKERIVTSRSGVMRWNPPFKARSYIYDKAGVLAETEPPVLTYAKKPYVTVPEMGVVVFERVQ